jgi:hypothetical protein
MTSEEIKALGLRVGDVVRRTVEGRITAIDDYSDEPNGPLFTFKDGGSHWPIDIVAIERVMPGLPDGWTWIEITEATPHLLAAAQQLAGDGRTSAAISRNGGIRCARNMETVNDKGCATPALVAKALLEVWGRTQ